MPLVWLILQGVCNAWKRHDIIAVIKYIWEKRMLKRLAVVLVVLSFLLIENICTYAPNDKKGYNHQKNNSTEHLSTVSTTGVPHMKPAAATVSSKESVGNGSMELSNSTVVTQAITPGTKPACTPAVNKGLVELLKLDSSFVIDLKYASSDNFTGKRIYTQSKCILHKNTAAKLVKANSEFKKLGYRIKILDAYRPYSAQKLLWDAASDKSFVADPKKGSVHNRGAAVDVTLVDNSGEELPMPSEFDEFTKRAHLNYKDCPENRIKNRELLGKIMVKCGFKRISNEWWHFDDTDAKKYPIQDIPFEGFQ